MIRGLESDPSRIVIDHYTDVQTKAQAIFDSNYSDLSEFAGELLVVIPFRDRWDLTTACLKALNNQSIPSDLSIRVVLVDNGSVMPETLSGIASASEHCQNLKIEILRADYPFNFSKLNNDAFKKFRTQKTKWVLFLNNDVSLDDRSIVTRMTSCLETVWQVGAIGCTLLYPNRRIQHLFAAPGVKIIAAHPLKGTPYNAQFAWFEKSVRPVAAITGAVMMLRAAEFESLRMFDEKLPTMSQDIDLCMSVYFNLGKYCASLSSADVIHKESVTKTSDFSGDEVRYVKEKWGHLLDKHPLYSTKLSRFSERPLLEMIPGLRYPVEIIVTG